MRGLIVIMCHSWYNSIKNVDKIRSDAINFYNKLLLRRICYEARFWTTNAARAEVNYDPGTTTIS